MIAGFGQALDGHNLQAGGRASQHRARTQRRAVELYRTGAAEACSAAIFAADQSQMVPQHPQQWRRWIQLFLYDATLTVYVQVKHGAPSSRGIVAEESSVDNNVAALLTRIKKNERAGYRPFLF